MLPYNCHAVVSLLLQLFCFSSYIVTQDVRNDFCFIFPVSLKLFFRVVVLIGTLYCRGLK